MAPTLQGAPSELTKRQLGYGYGYGYNYDSPWYSYGRWILLVGLIALAVLIALSCSCINARRRRRRGVQPMYGTGWLAGKTPEGHNGPSYTGYNSQAAPPPQYSAPQNPQYTGNTFNANEGYYGQQQGIELQQPATTYAGNGGQNVYDAPQGPPPAKTRY